MCDRRKRRKIKTAGFTMVELVAVLIVLGILTVVVVSHVGQTPRQAEMLSDFNKFKTHLRYAQVMSMNTNKYWGIRFVGNSYRVFTFEPGPPIASIEEVRVPSEESETVSTHPNNINRTPNFGWVYFDHLGRPFTGNGNPNSTTLGNANMLPPDQGPVTFTFGDRIAYLHPDTGFVP